LYFRQRIGLKGLIDLIPMADTFIETEKKILASGIEMKYLSDEYIFRKGQKAEYVFFLKEGSLLIDWPSDKLKSRTIHLPCFIGIEEAMEGKNYSCSTQTVVDCKFLVFEREYFLMLMNEFEAATPYFLQKKEDFKILSS
jgi:CRP-like cAMP-binding protein